MHTTMDSNSKSSVVDRKSNTNRWIDAALYTLSLVLLIGVFAYLLRATRLETHRLTHQLSRQDDLLPITRRMRTIHVEHRDHTTDDEQITTPISMHHANMMAETTNTSLPTGRRLLAAAVENSKPSYAPFESEASKQEHYAQWEKEFNVLTDKYGNGQRAFVEWLEQAVNPLVVQAAPLGSTDYCIGGFDGREDPDFIFVLKHTFHMLQGATGTPRWSVVLFVTPENEPWFVRELKIGKGLPGEHIKLIRTSPIGKRQASTLAASRHFYEQFPCEHIVYVQPDAFMIRSPRLEGAIHDGPDMFDLMHKHIYLGAPWSWCNDEWCQNGGNGGASFRKKSGMLDLTRHIGCGDWRCDWVDTYTPMQHNPDGFWHVEDTFFSHVIHERRKKFEGKLPSMEESAWWSMESRGPDNVSPYFVHKIWLYMSHLRYIPIMSRVKQYYPELWKTKT